MRMLPLRMFPSISIFLIGLYWANIPAVNPATNPDELLSILGDPFQGNPFESVPVMEKMMKKLVTSGMKKALPYLMITSAELDLSPQCTHAFMRFIKAIMDIKDWAFKMVDALGKPSAGILEGTATALGDYDECIEIMVPKNRRTTIPPPYSKKDIAFYGQYCMIQVFLPEAIRHAAIQYQLGNRSHSALANSKTFLRSLVKIAPRADIADIRVGVCIPSTCTINDIQKIVNEVMKMIKLQASTLRCESADDFQIWPEQIIVLTIIGLLIFLTLCGVLYEGYLRCKLDEDKKDLEIKKHGWGQYLLAFSAYNNFKELLSFDDSKSSIQCLRGMKFISVCLYVVVATYATPHDYHFLKYRSVFHFYKFMEEWWFTVFANASAGVDTIFFICGLQISYRHYKQHSESTKKKPKINILSFWAKWAVRFGLCQLVLIGLFMLLPLIGSGPIWQDVVTPEIEKCRQNWWWNILFINNFFPSKNICLMSTWILTSIMHLLIIAPILLYVLKKCASVGVVLILTLIVGSSVAIAIVTLIYDLPPAPAFYFLSFLNLNNIWDKLFIQAYDHLSPFCVGILLGYHMAKRPTIKLSKTVVSVGWVLTIVCNLTVLCGLYGYRHGEDMIISLSALYASVHRFVWSLGIAWIVFACHYGYGGIVNSILSWQFLLPFERLVNFTYLLHPLILNLHGGQIREKMYMAHLDQAMYATAYIVSIVALSVLCYLIFYSPFKFFETKILQNCNKLNTKMACVLDDQKKDQFGINIASVIQNNPLGGKGTQIT